MNGEPIHVSTIEHPPRSLYVTGFPYNVAEDPGLVIEQFATFLRKGLLVRRLGSAALDLAYVACGRLDAFWEMGLSPWDMAAGALLVLEAGGLVGDLEGEAGYLESGDIAAATPKVFPALLETLEG